MLPRRGKFIDQTLSVSDSVTAYIKDELHTSPRLHFIPPTHCVSNEKMKYGDASPLNNLDKWREERWVYLLAANFGTSLQ